MTTLALTHNENQAAPKPRYKYLCMYKHVDTRLEAQSNRQELFYFIFKDGCISIDASLHYA